MVLAREEHPRTMKANRIIQKLAHPPLTRDTGFALSGGNSDSAGSRGFAPARFERPHPVEMCQRVAPHTGHTDAVAQCPTCQPAIRVQGLA